MEKNRLFRILYYIMERGKATASELAEKFEVSVRTIYRDIDSLSGAGIPIFAIQGKGGGIELNENFVLNKTLLSAEEREHILTALESIKNTNEAYNNELLTKLSAIFKIKNPNWVEIDFSNWHYNPCQQNIFNNLKTAILKKRIITFKYFNSKQEKSTRKVKPVRLVFKGFAWYLYSYCVLRNDFRFFKLSRMKELTISSEIYNEDFSHLVIEKKQGAPSTIRLKLKFDKKAAFRVYDEFSDDTIEEKNGNLYTEIEIPDDYSIESYIFSFGDCVEVLEPENIRRNLAKKLKNMQKKYITDKGCQV